ncbi:alpha-L-rhamnosidase [Aspergillus costaricaensis CBS 115574]|uniref:Alpha-L-rhamnosidase n=1 Tax=Aspergillus costaricaensis CBS 115574 TaxID=1448317 RepID=A0ACD1IDL6_9EURO|nr:alpha-L-rhamnosidase [Aspergillus costaricaensis CBS 115574]RAK88100.1 alpha-L-rhamnosidase [Aspergillus costaricaensis CBS 115574]
MASPDWTRAAPWIWLPHYLEEDNRPGRFFLFRKTFQWHPSDNLQDLSVHVSADSRYRLFINGHRVSWGPCKSYPGKWYYETVDISPYLRDGENVISARVLRYSTLVPGSSSIVSMPLPGFMLYSPHPELAISTDPSWTCIEQRSVKIIPQTEWNYLLGPPFLSNNERAEEDQTITGWQMPGYDDATWDKAVFQSNAVKMLPIVSPWKLAPRPIPDLPEIEGRFDGIVKATGSVSENEWNSLVREDQPVVIPANAQVTVDLSVEALMTAFVSFGFSGGAGAEISILYSECYEKDLGVEAAPFPMPRTKSNRSDASGRLYGVKDFYTATSGQDVHSFETFWFRCFRYVQLEITTTANPITLTNISLRETSYPLEITTKVDAGAELNKIWEISLRTLQNCRHETYEDCPFYEQNQFASDSRLQMLFTYQLSPDDRLARKTLEEFHASRTPDGLIVAQYPTGFASKQIPQFSLFWILMVHDHMMYFADRTLVRRYLSTVDSIIQHFEGLLDDRGLVGQFDPDTWPFVDWVQDWFVPGQIFKSCMPPAYHTAGAATVNSLMYAYALLHAAELCEFVGRISTAEEYRARVHSIRSAVNQRCTSNSQLYLDGPGVEQYSQHTQVFAILSETVTGDAAKQLLRQTVTDSSLAQCSYAMKFYVFRAAEKTGIYSELFSSMLDPWRSMMANNLTTWAEDEVNARSDCHGWSASPVNEIVTQLFGVKPAEPGFERVRIEPRRELVAAADGLLHTSRGNIKVQWAPGKPLSVEVTSKIHVEIVVDGRVVERVLGPGESVTFAE